MQSKQNKGLKKDLTQSIHLSSGGLYLELGRNYWPEETNLQLFDALTQRGLPQTIQTLFQDNQLNCFENKPVTHVAWRNQNDFFHFNCNAEIKAQKQRNALFATEVISGTYRGFYGERITDIVSVGIGGSYLGNALLCDALKDFHHTQLTPHFLTAPDPFSLNEVLSKIDPRKTLWLFNSKSFTTYETITLLATIKKWFLQTHSIQAMEKHFFAVTCQVERAYAQGFKPEQVFYFDSGVGGRFSLWSSAGLIALLILGPTHYEQVLCGAHDMDQHFLSSPIEKNMPVALAWLDYYYAHFLNAKVRAVIPYSERLALLPQYLQQVEMESLGKSFLRNETFAEQEEGLVVFGGVGPGTQHSFHQFLYQNDQLIPVDFIVMKKTSVFQELQDTQLAQCLAQAKALWEGNEQAQHGYERITGQKPSNLIILDELTPFTLGALLALYEHKVFVLGELYQINPFDQFGVEFGKKLVGPILDAFANFTLVEQLDLISKKTIRMIKSQ